MAKFEKLNKVSSVAVLKESGKSWDEWMRILDKSGARNWTHQELVAFLKKKYKLSPWWRQVVAVGFEIGSGQRQEGQNLKGEFAVIVSRTFPLGVKALWKAVNSPEGVATWLNPMGDFALKVKQQYEVEGGVFGEVRTFKEFERIRLTWTEEEWEKKAVLNLAFLPRTENKSVLVFHQEKLSSAKQREQMKKYWKTRIDELFRMSATPKN